MTSFLLAAVLTLSEQLQSASAAEGRYGATAPKPRALRCVESTEELLGEPLGRKYAERYFPPAAKSKVQEMVRSLLAVLKDDLRELKWMSDATRQQALAKVVLDGRGGDAGGAGQLAHAEHLLFLSPYAGRAVARPRIKQGVGHPPGVCSL